MRWDESDIRHDTTSRAGAADLELMEFGLYNHYRAAGPVVGLRGSLWIVRRHLAP